MKDMTTDDRNEPITVHIVTQADYDWTNLRSAWSTLEAATAERDRLEAADVQECKYGWDVTSLVLDVSDEHPPTDPMTTERSRQ